MDPDQLVHLLQGEHPQTLALILSFLDFDVASEVLANLPPDQRADVA